MALKHKLAALAASAVAVSGLALSPTTAQAAMGDDRVAYQPQVSCDPVSKPGVLASKAYLQKRFGGGSLGIVRSCGASGLSEHKEGRAWDWAFNARNAPQRSKAARALTWLTKPVNGVQGANARSLGVQYIIWNKRIWSAYRASEGWRAYSGANPHTDHIHISFTWNGASKKTSRWNSGVVQAFDYGPCRPWEGELAPRWTRPNLSPCPFLLKRPVASKTGLYVAQQGETIERVAGWFKQSQANLRLWNAWPSTGPVTLKPGQRIQVRKPAIIPAPVQSDTRTYASSGAGADRLILPQRPVTAGSTVRLSAEVLAPTGSRTHISASWYDAGGNFLSWDGGPLGPNSPKTWTKFSADLRVPAGAARAETVVNVLDAPKGSSLSVRSHTVTLLTPAPVPVYVPPVVSTQPAGTTLVRDLSRASFWDREVNGYLDELSEKGPGGDPVLRSTLVDGQNSNPYPGSDGIERNDLQGGDVPLGSTRWMTWNERFVKLPELSTVSWNLIGPNEIHGRTLNQAPVMPQISDTKRRLLNANAGRDTHRYFDLGEIKEGEWHSYKFGIHYTQGNDGWIELWKDGKRVVRTDGPTTTENYAGYWKFGHYRPKETQGTSIYDVSGVRIYK